MKSFKIKMAILVLFMFIMLLLASIRMDDTGAEISARDDKEWLSQQSDFKIQLENEFDQPILLENNQTYKQEVAVTNKANAAAFVRVLAMPTFMRSITADESVILVANSDGEMPKVTLDIVDKNVWMSGDDGYYYYLAALKKEETTPFLFKTVSLTIPAESQEEYQDIQFKLELKTEGISAQSDAFEIAWWHGESLSPSQKVIKTKLDEIWKASNP